MDEESSVQKEHCIATVSEDHEKICWGCGLHLLLVSDSPIFKCGWCGAVTNQTNLRKPDSVWFSQWRQLRDRSCVTILLLFMLFVICAGFWAVYPTVFSISYFCGVFHCIITAILALSTISSFCLAAFRTAGAPANLPWGDYSVVGKGDLENYTFCGYCSKPKPPRAHHCRSCKMCVLDMDHHCPFIGNCVGAANYRSFIAFLISIVISCSYVTLMTSYAAYHSWPALDYESLARARVDDVNSVGMIKQIIAALASSALLLTARGIVLMYLAFASISVEVGISVLLWQQLCYIYEGNTYINQISLHYGVKGDKGCQNLLRFFGCPYTAYRLLLGPASMAKLQESSCSKLL